MKKLLLTIFVLVLIVDLTTKIYTKVDTLIEWQELGLLTLMLFVAAGERIIEVAIGYKGVVIRQSLDKQVNEAEKDVRVLASLTKAKGRETIDELLTRTTGQSKDVWSRLVVYRLTMRILLRGICRANGMTLGDTTSFLRMLKFLREKKAIEISLQKDIELVRNVTFFFEWGTGKTPKANQIRDALKLAPIVIKRLEKLGGKIN